MTKVVHEFYANLSDNIIVQGEPQFKKVFVRGHIYEFFPRAIYEYLNLPFPKNFNFEKEYVLDDVTLELLGCMCLWPKTNILKVADLTLKYNGFHKIALSNWLPTKYVIIMYRDFDTLLYDIGSGAPVLLGQIVFGFNYES